VSSRSGKVLFDGCGRTPDRAVMCLTVERKRRWAWIEAERAMGIMFWEWERPFFVFHYLF